ncbi:hypothetical protein TgHK011_003195 [Trichoderma gracile]|nr:hypothetical protein TgHK011_003195 [Trichoderma gracile]
MPLPLQPPQRPARSAFTMPSFPRESCPHTGLMSSVSPPIALWPDPPSARSRHWGEPPCLALQLEELGLSAPCLERIWSGPLVCLYGFTPCYPDDRQCFSLTMLVLSCRELLLR